ncbi:tetratricopeptide repeat protein [Polyangium jinanense]|uniref:Tetratricopeptide repeat protein n=1 Tax=Polyangium jinanense TaxID=2829994 RepID=A0A9X3XGT0_9BACT|nr:hypothetical protein [Polyangium jinanense]MDC3962332.1 hypothetical protein [Polyangium jinanense]MDC3989095.1 hypothetical protein [Polyangium jinanense]
MNDDVLRAATRALRDDADASKGREAETRARVLATLKARRARKLAAIRVMVPLAAVLVGSVAWAEATHRLPDVWYELKHDLGFGRDEEEAPAEAMPNAPAAVPVAKNVKGAAPAEVPAEKAAEPEVPPPSEPQVASVDTVGAQIVSAPKIAAAEPPKSSEKAADVAEAPAAAAPAPRVDTDDALYRAAHQAHFVTRDPGAALAAWDAYLRAAPRGRFAPEAHYNRALCLVRLGRTAEAERTLELFASGSFGGYRKAEAKALLDAMRGPTP